MKTPRYIQQIIDLWNAPFRSAPVVEVGLGGSRRVVQMRPGREKLGAVLLASQPLLFVYFIAHQFIPSIDKFWLLFTASIVLHLFTFRPMTATASPSGPQYGKTGIPIYIVGTIFGVPVSKDQYVYGVIARTGTGGRAIAYFFAPDAAFEDLDPKNAIATMRISDRKLLEAADPNASSLFGPWVLHGNAPDWEAEEWAYPSFSHKSGRRVKRVTYDDAKLRKPSASYPVSAVAAVALPSDELMTYRKAEKALKEIVKQRASQPQQMGSPSLFS